MIDTAPPDPQSPTPPAPAPTPARSASLRRVVILACLAPVLAMIVIGASRFESILAISVRPASPVVPEDGIPLLDVRPAESDLRLVEETPYASSAADAAAGSASTPVRGVPVRTVRTVLMEVTAYCPCPKCCGKNARGITASGKPVSYNAGRFVAADTARLPFGTKLKIPGYHDGEVVEVLDRGGAIKGDRLDVYFPDHETARRWGRVRLPVQIVEPIERDEPGGAILP